MIWPIKKLNKVKSKPRFARSYQGAKASRLLTDFLSPSSSADKEIGPALRTRILKIPQGFKSITGNELFESGG